VKTVYLLPCSCGRKIPVETQQAGDQVRCECGLTVDIPTLMGMKQLEQVEAVVPVGVQSHWGLRQGLILSGAIIAFLATLFLGYCAWTWPSPERSMIDYSPSQALHFWLSLPSDVENIIAPADTFRNVLVRQQLAFALLAALVLALGIGVCVAGLFVRNTPPDDLSGET
jgi:hypothetical protein